MEYNKELYSMNKFCEFKNRHTESEFREHEKIASLNIARYMILFMGIIFIVFAVSDYYFYGERSAFIFSLVLRGISLVFAIITFSVAGSFKRYNHTLIMITSTVLVVFAIYLLNLYILKADQPALQFMSVMIFILTVFLIPNL